MDNTTTGSTTTGPATFAEAFAADASSASNPTPAPEATASASTDTTDPSAASTGPEGTTPAPGEPPQERWADILENARTKAREEEAAQWKQVEWAKHVSQQEFQQIADLARKANTDPIAYLQDFIKELQAHPTYGAQLKSLAARELSRRNAPAEPQEPQPDLPLQLEDGRVVQLYSAEQQAKRDAWLKQQLLSQVKQDFQPVTETMEAYKASVAQAQQQRAVAQYVDTTRADVLTWPGMEDTANQAAVAAELARAQVNGDDPREVTLALNAAYRKVVLPTLSAKRESQVLENLQRKAAASSSVNPGSAATSTPRSITKFSDLPPEAWR